MILSWDDKKTQREERKIHARNKNKIIMKLEQDTPTKAGIGLETNDFGDK
jgi:hypothetical protein